MPCLAWKCVPSVLSRSLGVICYDRWLLSEGHKNYFNDWWPMNSILSKVCTPDNFESHNSIKLSFMNTYGLCLNFVECESFLESNSPDILALCGPNLDDSFDPGNFFVTDYLPLIWKSSITHIYGLAVYVKEGLPFAWDLSLESSTDSHLCFWLALLHSSIDHLLQLYAWFFILFHLT